MSRAIPEWISKTDDEAIPVRVRLRTFQNFKGVCHSQA
ncbi:hypothetical protein M2192_000359 [Bradyrhizobium elkanii USDA 61]|uniref:Uncharacterized protein n=1 Tax=Bradyrhizobium elkanii TaxID=29448 RepID=A0A8I1YFY6_BRAEL|nr:hypothetical protein [Bradyrhizobium elkanii]MCS4003399.1 hypothetical protein [Bradyrhizobium elkanii USDA 61]MCP1933343.1 hypothetical protein [Bradyrhizobium elkanii]MCS3478648.1 hypothetical protein [Bradyrhizobium elkanii]MCS3585420.1 hypothetical protein [Bradyrhizobium elkanii]